MNRLKAQAEDEPEKPERREDKDRKYLTYNCFHVIKKSLLSFLSKKVVSLSLFKNQLLKKDSCNFYNTNRLRGTKKGSFRSVS